MEIVRTDIDDGMPFDWGKTSEDYAKYRDIYPQEFYQKILERNLCVKRQRVLDVGTGTGVIPRNMYKYGAEWVGTDISEGQIEEAKQLSIGMHIDYYTVAAEDIDFPNDTFDVVTACQCYWYFDHEKSARVFHRILKPNGRILFLYMAWLPFEDRIARASEGLVLQYNPKWSGCGERMRPISIPDCYLDKFELTYRDEFLVKVPFTRESWNGRIKACRGVGASLSDRAVAAWEREHTALLESMAPDEFEILHYAAIAELSKR